MKLLADKPGKITPKILAEQTRFSFDMFPVAASMLTTTFLVIAFLAWNQSDHGPTLFWLIAAIIVIALRFAVYYAYKAATNPDENAPFWRRLFLYGAYSSSVVMAAAGFVFFPD